MSRWTITWLGQAGLILSNGGLRIMIDPFVSEHEMRRFGPPQPELVLTEIDWLLITHEHLDHLDLPFLSTLFERCPMLRVAVPQPLTPLVADIVSADQIVGVAPEDKLRLGQGVIAEVIPAYHSVDANEPFSDGSESSGSPRFVGYRVETEGIALYHAGDTIVTYELVETMMDKRVDVAVLPINGRDYFRADRGLVGNMDAREAVEFAQVIGAQTLIPIHWDLIEGNTVLPGTAIDASLAANGLHVLYLARFVPFTLA